MAGLLQPLADIDVVGRSADGVEAVELSLATRPDVVIMDVQMPRLNGVEATRDRRPTRRCPRSPAQGCRTDPDRLRHRHRVREPEILDLIAAEKSSAQIPGALYLSTKTVRNNLSMILTKLRATDRSMIIQARDAGIGALSSPKASSKVAPGDRT